MNHYHRNGEDLTARRISDPEADSVGLFRAAWHRPAITIIDLKRTMFGDGLYFDGINISTFGP
jgi:hypothetical protein